MKKIILASNSPRRKEILENIPLEFIVIPSGYEEKDLRNENFSYDIIENSSYCKALDVASVISGDALIIAADTMVILDSVCLLKPQSKDEAFSLLKRLSGRAHNVVTSISLIDASSKEHLTRSFTTCVEFRELSDAEIVDYIENFNPLDKAGSYGIQDFVDEKTALNPPPTSFIKKIEGDYYNVMGISPTSLLEMIKHFGVY